MTEALPAHSTLGASSAERWMECPGSVALINTVAPQALTDDDPDYRREGTAAHAALAHCMTEGLDAWEVVGLTFEGEVVDAEMADAIQVFIDFARPIQRDASRVWVESKMHHADFHPQFFGTVDFAALQRDGTHLEVIDYKHGEGVLVPVMGNPQFMYYAYGIVRDCPAVDTIRTTVIQPRITWQTPIRSYTLTRGQLEQWANTVLRPAMVRTATDHSLKPGEWCRFCPAKIICPVLKGLFAAAANADIADVNALTDGELDLQYPLITSVKQFIKALEAEVYARLMRGRVLAQAKLVKKRGDRVWRSGAEDALVAAAGKRAQPWPEPIFSEPVLKSPAQIEKLGGDAKALVHEWAHTPETGLTVAATSDGRPQVVVKSTTELFPGALASNDDGDRA